MHDSINGSDYGILNWDSPTRVPPNAEPSSPDVSLASISLITSCSWQTLSTLSSDNLPILIRLQMKTTSTPGLRRTYVNLKKANWDRYRQEVEAALGNRFLPTDCQRDEKNFRTVLLKAASHHIPTGRHRLVPTTPACTWWNRPEEDPSSGKLESTHPSRTSVKPDQVFLASSQSCVSTLTPYSSELLLPRHQGL